MQWRKVITADYSKFNLIIDDEYKRLNDDEYVYDHQGELLFFYNYEPTDIVVVDGLSGYTWEEVKEKYPYGTRTPSTHGFHDYYVMTPGLDCDGAPTFTHFTANYLGTHQYDVELFQPLTVKTVVKWFGWMLLNLNNSYLQIGKEL